MPLLLGSCPREPLSLPRRYKSSGLLLDLLLLNRSAIGFISAGLDQNNLDEGEVAWRLIPTVAPKEASFIFVCSQLKETS